MAYTCTARDLYCLFVELDKGKILQEKNVIDHVAKEMKLETLPDYIKTSLRNQLRAFRNAKTKFIKQGSKYIIDKAPCLTVIEYVAPSEGKHDTNFLSSPSKKPCLTNIGDNLVETDFPQSKTPDNSLDCSRPRQPFKKLSYKSQNLQKKT